MESMCNMMSLIATSILLSYLTVPSLNVHLNEITKKNVRLTIASRLIPGGIVAISKSVDCIM